MADETSVRTDARLAPSRRSPRGRVARQLRLEYARGVPRRRPVADTAPRNVPELFLERVGRTPDAEAFRYPAEGAGGSSAGSRPRSASAPSRGGLRALGVAARAGRARSSPRRGSSGSSPTSGSSSPGGATTTIYPSSMRGRVRVHPRRLRRGGGLRRERGAGREARRRAAPSCPRSATSSPSTARRPPDGWVVTLAELEAKGRAWDAAHPGAFEERAAAIRRGRARHRASTPPAPPAGPRAWS